MTVPPRRASSTLKRIEGGALFFTTALWTRKAREVAANPRVSLLFHWPRLGRQAHVTGEASLAAPELADELFAERDIAHRFQTLVSRQGEEIESIEPLRARLAHLVEVQESPPARPDDWGVLRILPTTIELWEEAPDRLHRRRLFSRQDDAWRIKLLAP